MLVTAIVMLDIFAAGVEGKIQVRIGRDVLPCECLLSSARPHSRATAYNCLHVAKIVFFSLS